MSDELVAERRLHRRAEDRERDQDEQTAREAAWLTFSEFSSLGRRSPWRQKFMEALDVYRGGLEVMAVRKHGAAANRVEVERRGR